MTDYTALVEKLRMYADASTPAWLEVMLRGAANAIEALVGERNRWAAEFTESQRNGAVVSLERDSLRSRAERAEALARRLAVCDCGGSRDTEDGKQVHYSDCSSLLVAELDAKGTK